MEITPKRTLETESYETAKQVWPKAGRHVYGQFDEDTIVVYQAYNEIIAEHKKFVGCPIFSNTRMTWIKTNFLWMMYRCDWATKDKNQTKVLAIWLKRSAFEEILSHAVHSGFKEDVYGTREAYNKAVSHAKQSDYGLVRLQWDPGEENTRTPLNLPDHGPTGTPHPRRRAIQLGMKKIEPYITGDYIVDIQDISDFVAEQREHVRASRLDLLQVPKERVYELDAVLFKHLRVGDEGENTHEDGPRAEAKQEEEVHTDADKEKTEEK